MAIRIACPIYSTISYSGRKSFVNDKTGNIRGRTQSFEDPGIEDKALRSRGSQLNEGDLCTEMLHPGVAS